MTQKIVQTIKNLIETIHKSIFILFAIIELLKKLNTEQYNIIDLLELCGHQEKRGIASDYSYKINTNSYKTIQKKIFKSFKRIRLS